MPAQRTISQTIRQLIPQGPRRTTVRPDSVGFRLGKGKHGSYPDTDESECKAIEAALSDRWEELYEGACPSNSKLGQQIGEDIGQG